MMGKREIPWPGMILAVLCAAVMPFAGVGLWLTLMILAVWIGSLFLPMREPVVSEERTPAHVADARDVLRQAIEPLGEPLILFNRDRVIAANASARAALGRHIVGQDARIALRHPQAMRLLDMPDGSSVTIRGLTGGRSLWQLTRHRIDEWHWVIELVDRTAEADISRAHTDFVANASHELRTPLAAIIGFVETLAEPSAKVDAETAAKFHQTVLREARRMQSLVADLMSLSQLEAEKHDVPTQPLDIGQLAARVAGEFSLPPLADKVNFTPPTEPVVVAGDNGQLGQLLRNLIDNGFKYGDSERGIDLTVGCDQTQRCARITVTDHGMGIAPEHLPHLTRRFYRTDPGRSRAGGGTGLGLAIVKHIVERHRGKLDIASTLGQGTRVTVELPLVAVPVETAG